MEYIVTNLEKYNYNKKDCVLCYILYHIIKKSYNKIYNKYYLYLYKDK